VTDGASGIDQLRSKIRHPNNPNRGGLQVTAGRARTAKLSHEAAGACTPHLAVYTEVTADIDGTPWPPQGDRWRVVSRDRGTTKWRRIVLENTIPPPRRSAADFAFSKQHQKWRP
jgi:hypothetical protein